MLNSESILGKTFLISALLYPRLSKTSTSSSLLLVLVTSILILPFRSKIICLANLSPTLGNLVKYKIEI